MRQEEWTRLEPATEAGWTTGCTALLPQSLCSHKGHTSQQIPLSGPCLLGDTLREHVRDRPIPAWVGGSSEKGTTKADLGRDYSHRTENPAVAGPWKSIAVSGVQVTNQAFPQAREAFPGSLTTTPTISLLSPVPPFQPRDIGLENRRTPDTGGGNAHRKSLSSPVNRSL